jgi:hypothetical protein
MAVQENYSVAALMKYCMNLSRKFKRHRRTGNA